MYRVIAWLIPVAVLAGLCPAVGTALARGSTQVPPKRFVLTVRDLPRNFRQVAARGVDNARAEQIDHLPPGTYARHGRISSYQTSFRGSGFHLFSVDDTVVAFTSPRGAHWEFVRSVGQGRKPLGGEQLQPLSVGHIGNEAAGFRYQRMVNSQSVTCGIALFRRGSYAAWVASCGVTGVYLPATSAILARIIDRRIQSTS